MKARNRTNRRYCLECGTRVVGWKDDRGCCRTHGKDVPVVEYRDRGLAKRKKLGVALGISESATEGPPAAGHELQKSALAIWREEHRKFINSAEWQRIRKRIIERDEGQCQSCPAPGTQVHHTNYDQPFGQERDADLVLLCRRCHRVEHKNYNVRERRDHWQTYIWAREMRERWGVGPREEDALGAAMH